MLINFSFILVNYKSREYAEKCIDSLFLILRGVSFEIILVNNDISPFITKNSKIKIIEAGSNLGFGKASNLGASVANGSFLCFINPDTQIISGDFSELKNLLSNPTVGIVGPHIFSANGKTQQWSFGEDITPWSTIKNNLPFFKKKPPALSTEKDVAWVTGAAIFIKKDFFENLNGFDEKIFLYFEDIDLCRRARINKKRVIFYPKIKILHLGGKSSPDKAIQKRKYYKSQDYYMRKHFGFLGHFFVKFLRFLRF